MLVFLFGNYDSRGGTTGIAAPDRDSAFDEYAKATYLDDLDENAQRRLLDADYLGPAILTGDLPGGVEGVDLEWGPVEGAIFCQSTPGSDGRNGQDRARWTEPDTPIELLYVASPQRDDDETPVPPPGYWYPRWDDDEYAFVLVPRTGATATT